MLIPLYAFICLVAKLLGLYCVGIGNLCAQLVIWNPNFLSKNSGRGAVITAFVLECRINPNAAPKMSTLFRRNVSQPFFV